MCVGKDRQPIAHRAQLRGLLVGKSAGPIGCVTHHVPAIDAWHRKGEILNASLVLDVVEDRKIELRVRPDQTAADGFAAVAHARHEVFLIRHDIHDLVYHHDFLGLRGGPPPDVGRAEKLRVQCPAMHGDTQHRKAGGVKPPCIFVKGLGRGTNQPGGADQPGRNRVHGVVARPFRHRTLVDAGRKDALAFPQPWPAELGARGDCFFAHGFFSHDPPSVSAD
jgi:hypothetical protein